jgi:hypothetical protein
MATDTDDAELSFSFIQYELNKFQPLFCNLREALIVPGFPFLIHDIGTDSRTTMPRTFYLLYYIRLNCHNTFVFRMLDYNNR